MAEPKRNTRLGISGGHKVRDDCKAVGTCGHDAGCSFRCQTADGYQRQRTDFCTPFFNAIKPLWCPRHRLELGFIDRPKSDVLGFNCERRREFLFVVGRNADPDTGPLDCRDVGLAQIVLAEMNKISAGFDRDVPIVVQDQLAAVRAVKFSACLVCSTISVRVPSLILSCTSLTPSGTMRANQPMSGTIG